MINLCAILHRRAVCGGRSDSQQARRSLPALTVLPEGGNIHSCLLSLPQWIRKLCFHAGEKGVSAIGGHVPHCGGTFGAGRGDSLAGWSVELLEVPRSSCSGGNCQKMLAALEKSLSNGNQSGQVELQPFQV